MVRDHVAALVAELAAADALPREARAAVLAVLGGIVTRLGAGLLIPPVEEPSDSTAAEEKLICVKEAAARLAVSPQWMYRRKDRLPFVQRLGVRSLRISRAALDRYLTTRRP
jgi:excisionase family DNA binding protein